MRYFLSRRIPPTDSILLVESGSRSLVEKADSRPAGDLGRRHPHRPGHLLLQTPAGIPAGDYPRLPRHRLPRQSRAPEALPRTRAEPLFADGHRLLRRAPDDQVEVGRWPCAFRAKIFIINENGDYFWLDRGHLDPLRAICAFALRSGRRGGGPHPRAGVFLPVHFGLSVTLCNDRSCPQGPTQRLIDETHSSE